MVKDISFTELRPHGVVITQDTEGNLHAVLNCSMIGGNDALVRTIELPLTAGEESALKQRIVQKVTELVQQEGV